MIRIRSSYFDCGYEWWLMIWGYPRRGLFINSWVTLGTLWLKLGEMCGGLGRMVQRYFKCKSRFFFGSYLRVHLICYSPPPPYNIVSFHQYTRLVSLYPLPTWCWWWLPRLKVETKKKKKHYYTQHKLPLLALRGGDNALRGFYHYGLTWLCQFTPCQTQSISIF